MGSEGDLGIPDHHPGWQRQPMNRMESVKATEVEPLQRGWCENWAKTRCLRVGAKSRLAPKSQIEKDGQQDRIGKVKYIRIFPLAQRGRKSR